MSRNEAAQRQRVLADVLLRDSALPEAVGRVAEGFARLGFEVLRKGSRTLTLGGSVGLHEATFATRLKLVKPPDARGPSYYRAKTPLRIPAGFEAWVEAVTLPTPHEFF
jgi:hypothetical protein